jgi:hypothetical protein
MRIALAVVAACALVGCVGAEATRPVNVQPPPVLAPGAGVSTMLMAMVVDSTGRCIPSAVVRVVRGQGVGRAMSQTEPCDAWSYGTELIFDGLTPGVELTLQATAEGYATQERTVVPIIGPRSALLIVTYPD